MFNTTYIKTKYRKFTTLTKEKCEEIDNLVNRWWYRFHTSSSYLINACRLAEKLTISAKIMGLNSGDEIFYFYIKMLDPDFKLLEIHEISNTKEEFQKLVKMYFPFFDNCLLKLEKALNNQLKIFEANDLWAESTIKK